jgi:lipase maturation factor 1
MAQAVLIYDGDCSFCRRWVARWKYLTGDAIEYEPYQSAAQRYPEIPVEAFKKSVHLIEADGAGTPTAHTRAAHAVFRALALAGRKRYLLWAYLHLPLMAQVTEAAYAFVAEHRDGVDRLDRWIGFGSDPRPANYVGMRSVFLRLLALIYLCAFISLRVQVDGLIGSQGILPAANLLHVPQDMSATHAFFLYPTLMWFDSSDRMLHLLVNGGIALSIAAAIGLAPILCFIGMWIAYLSLMNVGQGFFPLQWDVLLLEAGFLAIFFSPWLWVDSRRPPSFWMVLLFRWLVFRVMFYSAAVKWISHDVAWRSLTAMKYHYWTQPIPPWTAWYAQLLPGWFGQMSVVVVFLVEGFVPFLYFGPRKMRLIAFWITVAFQLLILITGNFGFFNLLTIVLAITLLDDVGLRINRTPRLASVWYRRVRGLLLAPVIAAILAMSTMQFLATLGWPALLRESSAWMRYTDSWYASNPYGLFAVMTTTRPEILIEGSDDRVNWKEYVFRYKPGPLDRRPSWFVPHMPRLDWQMWFAALGDIDSNRWLYALMQKLLENDPAVTRLFAENPFANEAPKYMRCELYAYRFTDWETRKKTGRWWERRSLGHYSPVVSLKRDEAFLHL